MIQSVIPAFRHEAHALGLPSRRAFAGDGRLANDEHLSALTDLVEVLAAPSWR